MAFLLGTYWSLISPSFSRLSGVIVNWSSPSTSLMPTVEDTTVGKGVSRRRKELWIGEGRGE
jgi:hypothetical protein